jgi:hypothetical protein
LGIVELRFEHVDAAVSGMIEDELSSKTIHNAVTLLRTILAGKKGPSALRRGVAFRDSILGLELPPLHSRQITPPTPEFDATHLSTERSTAVRLPDRNVGMVLRCRARPPEINKHLSAESILSILA